MSSTDKKDANAILYLDGTAVDSVSISSVTNLITYAGLRLGIATGPTDAFKRSIDEARISNSTISSDWIATEYANQSDPASFFKQVSPAQGETQANTSPDLNYSMDEGYGSTLNSTGSNNHNGTISGALWRTEDLCVSGKCLYFDGTDDVVTTTDTTNNVKTVSF